MNREVLKKLLNVAQGRLVPDAIITNGRLINIFTNEIQEGQTISIKDGWIVSIEEEDKIQSHDGVREIDARGRYLCPGFIDAHTHIDNAYSFSALVPYALRGGTTTVVTECAMVATACGMEGLLCFADSTKGYPLRAYFVAPPLTPPYPQLESGFSLTLKQFEKFLKRDDCVGIGEAYWTRIVDGEEKILQQAALAMSLNKRLDGHSAGARGNRLIQYLLTGITSCHESVALSEAVEKLRFGVYVMIREGFVRKELKELSKLKDLNIDNRRIILTSDMFDAVMLVEDGYLDSVVRRAIEYGIAPIEAIKMATINPADYYGLRHLGAIAPLRAADILFLSSLEKVTVDEVMQNGDIVYSQGCFTGHIEPYQFPDKMTQTVMVSKLSADDYRINAKASASTVRIMELVNETIAKELLWKPGVEDGFLKNDPANDIVSVAVINRHNTKRMGKGFVKGTGVKNGAVATTLIWDTSNILVLGSDEKDMARAVARLMEIQGGVAVVQEEKVIYDYPMPVFGLIPLDPMEMLRDKIKGLNEAMERIGTSMSRPFLTTQTIPFTGLPFFRITDRGLADLKKKRLVPLFVTGDQP